MITFRCPRCSALVQAPDGKAGRPVTCRSCQHASVCPPSSVLQPLRLPSTRSARKVGSPEFLVTLGAIGLVCLVWVIWSAFDGPSTTAQAAYSRSAPVS